MLSLLNVFAGKKNLNAVLKGVIALVFFGVFSFDVFGQCNGLNVSVGSDIEACNGANITLTATYIGGPNSGTPIYQWSFNSDGGGGGGYVIILGATSSTYTITNFNNSTDGTYSCTVTFPDVNNCDDSDNVNVNFPNNNFDVNAGNDFSICQGSNATINTTLSNAPGGGNVTYAWNSVPIIPGTYPNQANPTFSGLPTGTYNFAVSATATDNGNTYLGCDIVQVIVNNLNLDAGNDQTICQGSAVNISSTISNQPSTPAVNYSWTAVNTTTGSPVTLTQTGSPSNPTFNNLPSGTYTFTGTASVSGCTDTDQIQVVVNPTPTTPTFTIPATGCPGVSIPISGFTPLANTTYSWYPNVGAFINGSTSNPSVTFNNGGNYNVYVTATNSNGCSSNSAIQNVAITNLQVLNPFVEFGTAALTANNYNNITTYTICSGVSGSSVAYIYNTFPNGSSATYSYSYGTQPSSPIFLGIAEEIGLSIGNNYFTITGALNGCVVSETFNIYAGSNPYVAGGVSNSVGLCTGQTVNFAISPVNPTTNSPNAAGTTYTIGVSDVSSSLPGAVNSLPYATYTDLIGNQNVSYTFNSSSCGQNPPGYPANTFYAVIQASNACGTTTSTVSPIVVSALPNSNFNVSATTICVNSSLTITNAGTSGNAITGPNNNAPFSCLNTGGFFYTISPTTGWTVSGGSIGAPGIPVNNWNGITAASNPATVSFNTSGTYIITQKYQNGCGISTSQRTICVVAPPTCAFTVNPTSSCTPLVTNITNNTTGPSCGTTPLALAYNWTVTNPVGGTSSVATATAVNPTITLNNNTVAPNLAALNFPITLVVNPLIPGTSTPVPNCSSTCNQTVTVYPQPSFITQPVQPPTVCLDGTFNSLSVTVSYLGPGLPSYQWYSNVNPVSSGGILIPGATLSSYVPPATAVGTIYYYCVVTFPNNTNCNQIISNNVAAIVVPDPLASASPTTQTICVGGTVPVPFTGTYTPGTGTATFEWNTVTSGVSSAISGAAASTYTPPAFTSTGTFNYSVTINTSGSGCNASTSAPIEVIVIPDPTITTQPIGNIYCQNTAAVNITSLSVVATGGSGTFSYQWFVNTNNSNTGGTAISGATSASFSPPSSTVGTFYYYCEISQPVTNCSVTSNPAQIIIVASPTFTAQPLNTQTLCNGGPITPLNVVATGGTGNITYQWYSNTTNSYAGGTLINGATQSSYTPPNTNTTLPNTTYYYCIVSYSAGGCPSITSNIGVINIYPALIISTQPLNAETICIGGTSSNLTVSILAGTGTGNYSYQWYSNSSAINSGGTAINGATSATLPSQVFNSIGAFYFYCIITDSGNGCGNIASAVATVTVVNDPTISVQPLVTQSICQNAAPIALEINASGGNGTLQYQWYTNTSNSNIGGVAISGATSPNYIPSSNNIGTYYYYCVITTPTSGCSVSSAVGSVIVISGPTFTTQPLSSVVCQGGSVQQMCVTFINGTGTPQYQWYSNSSASTSGGVAIPNANSNCYTPASNVVGTTYYYCQINLIGGGCSSILSNISSVIVNPIPVAQPIADLTFCNQETTSVVLLSSNEQNTTFQWGFTNSSIGNPVLNGVGNSMPSFVALNNSTSVLSTQVSYTPVYTNSGVSCSGTSSSFNIFVNPTPSMSLFNPELFVFCEASQGFVPFNSSIGGNVSYNYSNDNTLIGVPSTGVVSSVDNGLSFLAVNGSNQPLTSNFLVTPFFTNNNQSCPGNTVYFAVTINPLPDVVPISSYTVCATETASNLYSSINPIIGPGTDYIWTNTNPNIGMASTGNGSNYFTSTNTGLFPISGTVAVTPTYTNNGVTCVGGDIAFDITVNPMPIIDPITNQSLCLGDFTAAIAPSGPVPGTIFNWNNNNNSIGLPSSGTGAITSFLGLNNTNQANSATISFTPSYSNNNISCSGQSIQVGIIVNPVPVLQNINNFEICAQSNVSVPFLTTNNVTNTIYQWTNSNSLIGLPANGEGAISFLAQNNTSIPISAVITVTAMYVSSGDTCTGSTEEFTIVVLPTPTVNSIPNQTICADTPTTEVIFQADFSGTVFNWSNTNPNIGLPSTGSGNISSFIGSNNGTTPLQGLLTVIPSLTTNAQTCSGTPINATITINPTPAINSVPSGTFCEGEFINVVFGSNINSNVTYNWNNSNPSNGIGSSGNGTISFIGSNNSFLNEVSNFQVTPFYDNYGVSCPGSLIDFDITIIPTPSADPITDITICNTNAINEIVFSSPYASANFSWTNSTPSIGIGASGNGNIPLFNGVNISTNNPIVSTITVTPVITQSNLSCPGASETFNITILPTTTVNSISSQVYCNQDVTQFIPLTGTGNSFSWTNDNTNIGLSDSGTSAISSFQALNNSTQISVSNIEVHSSYTLNGVTCPGDSTIFNISVLPLPTSDISQNITICNGVLVPQNLITGNATNFNWTNSNSNIGLMNSGVGSIPSFTAINNSTNPISATITYTPIISSGNFSCFGSSNSYTITVQASPVFVVQPISSQTVCAGGNISPLTVQYSNGNGTPNYQWYSNTVNSYANGTAIPNETASTLTPSSSQAGIAYYYCIISFSGSGGCSMINSNIAEVVVLPDPTISTQPLATQTICEGGSIPAPLAVNYSGGTGLPSYQWYNATINAAIPGANGSSYTPPNFLSAGISDYYVAINLSGSGCDALTSANASVIVVADPMATISTGASYCQNAASVVPISVTVSNGEGISSYQWYSNTTSGNTSGTQIIGANTSTYTPPVNQTGNVYYYCAVTQSGANCAVNSLTSLITVTPAPTFTTQPTPTQSVCVDGTTTQLNVAYTNGTGTATYEWFSNTTNTYNGGTPIAGQTTSSFTPSSASSGTSYYYCVISFSAAGGCSMITSNIAEVVVLPDPTISTQPLTTQTICVGGSIPAPLSVNYSGGTGLPTYQWYNATTNTAIPGANGSSYTPPNFLTTGISDYNVTINLSGSGCDALNSANAMIIVVADPMATISTGASYCQNAASVVPLSVNVSNGEGTSFYQWYSNSTSGNNSGTALIGANTSTYTPPVNQTGNVYYYCVVTQSGANCAVNSPTSLITVTPAPTFTTQPTPTQSVCVDGTTTQLNVAYTNGTGTATYEWFSNTTNTYNGGTPIAGQTTSSFTPSSASSGTSYYYCVISFSAAGGCSMITSNIAEVVVLPDPTISTQPLTTQTICVGGTIPTALNVAFTGGVGNTTYQWFSAPAVTLGGETNNSFTPPIFNTPGTYNYYITIGLSGSGCDALTSANATVIVLADPIVSAQPTTTQSVCQNTVTSQLSVSITGGTGTASYQWYSNTTNSNVGGTPIAGATLNTYTPPSAAVGTQYYYCTITQTGTNCGVTSNPAEVVVNLAPIFSNQPINTQQHCLNQSTNPLQVAYSNGTGIPTYQWYTNNNNTISGGTPINLATNNTYSPPSNIDGTFYYYCVVSFVSGGGCPSITSNISEVIIHPYPIVAITGGETICLLESSDINFAFTPSIGLYDITYTANGQIVTLDNYNGANPLYTVTPSQTTSYVVTNIAYDQVPQCAIQPNTSIVVFVNPLPALNNSNYTFCSDVASTSLQYNPDANLYTYDWLPNSSANYLGQNNGPNVITVTLPDPVGNIPTSFYYVSNLTNNATGCQALDSILVTINPNPVGTFTLPTIGCINSPIALSNGDATIGNYEWYIDGQLYSTLANPVSPIFNSLGVHTIEMIATNTYGCTDTLNSSIQIYDQPVANFSTDLSSGCAPLPVNFSNLSTGSYITSYDWTFAPDTVSWNNTFTSTSSINPPTVTYLQGDVTTTYVATLSVTNACGTVTTQQNITVLPTPVAAFTFATPTICSGTSLIINNISVGEPLSYSWTYGNTISTNPNLQSMFFPSDSVTQVYPLTLTLANLCGTDTFIDSVTVLPDLVNGGFITSIDAGCSPLTVTLSNTTFNTSLSSIWHLDDPLNTIVVNQSSVQFTYYATNNTTQYYNPYLVVTDGCANDTIYANLSVFANPLPAITASQINICEGSTVDFSGSVVGGGIGFGYAWDFGGLGSANTQNASFNFTDGTNVGLDVPVTLTVSAPNNFGTNCINTTNTIIHVYSNPDLSQVTFNTTDGCSLLDVQVANLPSNLNLINWGDGSTNTNVGHTYVNNSSAIQSYNLGISSSVTYPTIPNLVCTSLANQNISVHPSPLPVIASSATQSCEGQMIDFTASTINNQNFGVDFSWNIGNLSTSNTSNTSYNFIAGSVAGIAYPIELTASQTTLGLTCSETVNSTVVIYDTPDVTPITFNTNSGCSDLEIIIANLPAANNQINWGDGSINSFNSHTYSNNGPGLLSYPVTVTSSTTYNALPQLTCTATGNQLIDVYPTPIPQITSSSQNICEGGNVNFTASTSNNQNSGVSYQWNFGSLGTSNLNATSILFSNGSNSGTTYPIQLLASQTVQGVYCSDSVSTTVVVYETPDVTPITFNTNSGCSDLEIIIANLPAANNQINWGDGITNFSNSHIYNNTGSGLLNYPITLTSTSTYGIAPQLNCVATLTQNITVYPTPLPQIFASAINVCEGDDIDFIASTANNQNTGITYLWDFGTMGTSSSANTTMTFDVGNATGLQTQVVLTAFQNTSGTICSAAVNDNVYVYDTPDLTTALYSDVNNCSPLLVSISNLPTSTYTYNWGDGIITSNPNHLYLNQGTTPLNYNITINATSFYQILPQLSCSSVANQIVQVNPQPFAAFTINPAESCFYAPVNTTLENTSQNAIAPYVWNYDGIAHTTNSLNYIATFNTPGAHLVELVVSNQFGCTDSVSHDFIIHELPTVTVNAIDDALCLGATTEFEIDGTGISTSSWDFGDGTTLNLLNPTSLVHYYNQPGVYSVTAIVTNIYGCSDTITFPNEVIIYPTPTASFTTNTTIADIVYPYFEFYDNSAGAINYYWNFGDSNWSNDVNPTHTYNIEGNYLVELTVTNEYNCFDIATQIVQVEGIVVYIPNAFTPLDYNGVNDVFKPSFSSTEGIVFYELCIFDRWGKRIFQTNEIDEAWIGNSQENDPGDDNYYAQNDTYIYTVRYRKKARANDPQPDQIITGHVMIIR